MSSAELNKKALLKALEKSMGIVTQACEKVGVSRVTFYKYKREDPEFRKAVEDIDEIVLDFAVSKLYKGIDQGNSTLIMYFLNNRGKSRGFSKLPQMQEGSERVNINITGMNEDAI